eukprot:TRINITY_DN66271_c5_g1_i2.p1 TRINITY_DN66271_c5_g1~~TRINITY_DN66271_c5_g1_i2.p1  ORF type:complete len:242 (+),score=5.05 TRINITY_DN66271_c5_g1_i2:21-746(+)
MEKANWAGWKGLNPIPDYSPIVHNINRVFELVSQKVGEHHTADWTDWKGLNPIESYLPITNNVNTAYELLVAHYPEFHKHPLDWTGWVGLNPIPDYSPLTRNIDHLFTLLSKQRVYHYTTALSAIEKSQKLRPSREGAFGSGVYFMLEPPSAGRTRLAQIAYDNTGQTWAAGAAVGCISIDRQELEAWLGNNGMELQGPLHSQTVTPSAHFKTGWQQPPWGREQPEIPLNEIPHQIHSVVA